MFNSFFMKLVTILVAATACMAGYPCDASAHSQQPDPHVRGGE
jgi:hypothetical protein